MQLPSVLKPLPILGRGALLEREGAPASLRAMLRFTLVLSGLLIAILLASATVIQVHGAVMAQGEVDVASKVKKIAHPTGGVVAQVLVHDGDHVRKGQLLIRLDSSVSAASASIRWNT